MGTHMHPHREQSTTVPSGQPAAVKTADGPFCINSSPFCYQTPADAGGSIDGEREGLVRAVFVGNLDGVQVTKSSSNRPGRWIQLLSGTAVGIAGFVLTLALTAVILSAVVAGLDPLVNVTTALVGLGSVGLMALLAVTALAIPIFFLKRHIVSFPTSIAPAAGGVMIAVAVCMAFANYSAVTGVDSVFVNHLPYLLIVVASIGAVQAQWIRWQRPDLYVRIGASRVDEAVGGCEPVES